jgi:arabinose-5-phosphate isomerase
MNEIITEAKQVMQQEAEAILAVKDQISDSFEKAVDLLLNCTGHVLVTGSGTSSSVARRMAHLLSCCGTPALFIDAGDSQHGLSGAVTPNDVLIAMSKGGQTSEVIILAQVTKEKGAKLISITENPQSDLGQMSDVVLKIVSPDDIDPYGMIATGSSLINSAVSDALCVVLLHQRGYSLDEFGKTHPGGAVGRKLEDLKTIER